LFPILKPVFPGRDTGFLLVGLKMADKKDGNQITPHRRKYFQGRSRLLENFPDIGGFLTDATGSLNSVSGRISRISNFSGWILELVMFFKEASRNFSQTFS
jgi:hypothetical protein